MDPLDGLADFVVRNMSDPNRTPTVPPPAPSWGVAPGVYVQIYCDALSSDPTALEAFLETVPALGVRGIIWHSVPHALAASWAHRSALAAKHGVQCGASWGVDGDRDEYHRLLTAAQKGDLIGQVLSMPDCLLGLVDAEGAWETNTGPTDTSTPAGATEMCEHIRAMAPDAVLGDQSWFAIESHDAFPDSKFAPSMTFRAPQMYCNDFNGLNRCQRIHDWMERDWEEHEAWLLRAKGPGFVKPRTVTLQGYGWQGIEPDLDRTLDMYADRPVIVYCEPLPQPNVVAAIRKRWA